TAEGDPYYPIPRPENAALYARYRTLAAAEPSVTFVGRLATYRYYNMDQVVAQALKAAEKLLQAGTGSAAPVPEPARHVTTAEQAAVSA
ncbi:MAG TPA: UDP-galactopyranose mutase, partial [Candidatus Limnocylindria bacterium]|nr:UDP-galactopyranose mutase [Candidatus Limnocylindria bacterium]